MFVNRRNFIYQNQSYPSAYTQAQIQQYQQNVLATRAKLQAYKEAILEAELQSRTNDPVAFVRGTMIDSSPGGTPPNGQDFVPYGHVSRAGSTPQSYSLWGSSEESNTDSITSHKRRFGKSLCKIITGFTAVLILMAVIGIVGIAVYLGYLSSEEEELPNISENFLGKIRVERGDSWVQDLSFPESPAFKAKAAKYEKMFKSVFEKSVLGASFEDVEVQKFSHLNSRNGFDLSFHLALDRAKIPFWHLRNTDQVIESIITQEVESSSPIAFHNMKVDTSKIEVKRLLVDPVTREELHEHPNQGTVKRKEDFEVVPLRSSDAGILRVRPTEIEQNYNSRIEEILRDGKVGTTVKYLAPKTTATTTTIKTTAKETPTPISKFTKSRIEPERSSETKSENEIEILFERVETTTDISIENRVNDTRPYLLNVHQPVNKTEEVSDNHNINETIGATLLTEGSSGNIFEDVMKILLGATSKDTIQWDNNTTTVILRKVTVPTEFFPKTTTSTTTTENPTTLPSLAHEQNPTTLRSLSYIKNPSTQQNLAYEHNPWKPIHPDYGKPLEYKISETDQKPSSREDQKNYIKFFPQKGQPQENLNLSPYSTNSISTTPSSASHSIHPLTSSSPLRFDSDMKLTSRKGHGITPSPQPVFISDSSHELDNSNIKLEGKSDFASSITAANENEALTEAPPTIKDIQSILENLLYIATMKPSTLLSLNDEENDKTTDSPKDVVDKIYKQSLTDNYNSQSEVKLELSEQSTSTDLRKPSGVKSGKYPLDKFRYPVHKYDTFTTSSTTERIAAAPYTPKLSLPFNIWNALTTNKPLMLQTDVVTSTSFEVNYGSTSASLTPVYIQSSTHNDLLDHELNKTIVGPNFLIPIISGKDVQYVKVNRTKENYPNVVIVNLSDSENRGLENIGPLLLDDKGKKVEFTSDFVASLSYLLDKIKQQGHESDSSAHPETSRNFQETSLLNKNELKNITFGNALSYLSTFIVKETVPKNFHALPNISAKDRDGFVPYEVKSSQINEKSNIVQDPVRSIKKNQKKSGKSLKISPTLTLFVVRQKNEKRPRVISIFDNSPEYIRKDRSKNSPIHVFKFKEGQSLDELLGEIFEAISKDKTVKNSSDSDKKGKDRDSLSSKEFEVSQSQAVPAGEDSLKVIEALSKLLTDHYENYNLVFGSESNHKPTPKAEEPFIETTTVEVDTSPVKNSVETEYNEIYFTLPKMETTTVNYPENKTKSNYHKYHHELFPVMTRPLNPIRSTTPTPSTKFNFISSEEVVTPDSSDSLDIVTSVDISYSMLQGNKTSGCTATQFKCSNNKKCIPMSSRCNLVRDCEDNSDERYCSCSEMLKSLHYTRKICDGIIDCWDKSDETNCDWCSPGQFICTGYQKCVKQEMVCDGVPDCPNGDDERDCVSVSPNIIGANSIDYHDEGYLMVRKKGTWGKLCVENFEKTVAKADVSWTVNDLGDAVCKTLTFDSSSRVERILDSSPPIFRSVSVPYFELSINDNYFDSGREGSTNVEDQHSSMKRSLSLRAIKLDNSGKLKGSLSSFSNAFELTLKELHEGKIRKRDTSSSSSSSSSSLSSSSSSSSNFERSLQFKETKCLNRDVVKIKCEELQCGVRPRVTTQTARIVGGNNSSPGAWPWHAALYKEGEYQCGATLINKQWLLSAGHCFYSARSSYWVARLGALRRGTKFPSPFEQVRTLSHIFIHPEYVNQGFINDISMLRLKEPIKLNDYVRPVCLPPPQTEIKDGQRCTLVGWGQLFEVKKVFPDTLQEVEVPLISTGECRKRTLFLPLYRLTEDMFCAGYVRGGRDACLGDSGGPLMCQKSNGKWEVMGVTSNGYGCARPHRPGVYTKVGNYLPWIEQVMELGEDERVVFEEAKCGGVRCPLGECIPPSGICNGKVECSNAIDEKNCSKWRPYERRFSSIEKDR